MSEIEELKKRLDAVEKTQGCMSAMTGAVDGIIARQVWALTTATEEIRGVLVLLAETIGEVDRFNGKGVLCDRLDRLEEAHKHLSLPPVETGPGSGLGADGEISAAAQAAHDKPVGDPDFARHLLEALVRGPRG